MFRAHAILHTHLVGTFLWHSRLVMVQLLSELSPPGMFDSHPVLWVPSQQAGRLPASGLLGSCSNGLQRPVSYEAVNCRRGNIGAKRRVSDSRGRLWIQPLDGSWGATAQALIAEAVCEEAWLNQHRSIRSGTTSERPYSQTASAGADSRPSTPVVENRRDRGQFASHKCLLNFRYAFFALR